MAKKFTKGVFDLTRGGVALSLGNTVIGSLPHTGVTDTATRSMRIASVGMIPAAGALTLNELRKLERKKRKRR